MPVRRRREAAQCAVEIRSTRGIDARKSAIFVKQRPRGHRSLVLLTLQAVQGLVRPPADQWFACGGRRTECAPTRRECHGRVRTVYRGCSSAGRAPALHAGGHRFESGHLHQYIDNRIGRKSRFLVEKPTAIFWIFFISSPLFDV
jgi:hypothetical protein